MSSTSFTERHPPSGSANNPSENCGASPPPPSFPSSASPSSNQHVREALPSSSSSPGLSSSTGSVKCLPRVASCAGPISQRVTVNEHTVVCLSADVTPLHLSAAVTDCHLDMHELSSATTPHSFFHQSSAGSKEHLHTNHHSVSSSSSGKEKKADENKREIGISYEDKKKATQAHDLAKSTGATAGLPGRLGENNTKEGEDGEKQAFEKRQDEEGNRLVRADQSPTTGSKSETFPEKHYLQNTEKEGEQGGQQGVSAGSPMMTHKTSPRGPSSRISAHAAGMAGAIATTNAQQNLPSYSPQHHGKACDYTPLTSTTNVGGGGVNSSMVSDLDTTAYSSSCVPGPGVQTPGSAVASGSAGGERMGTGLGENGYVKPGGLPSHQQFSSFSGMKEGEKAIFPLSPTTSTGAAAQHCHQHAPSTTNPVLPANGFSSTRGVERDMSPCIPSDSFSSLGVGGLGGKQEEVITTATLQQPETIPTAARILNTPMVGGMHSTGSITTTVLPNKPLILIIITGGTICMDYGGEQSSMRPRRLAQRLETLPELKDPNLPLFDVLEWDTLIDSSEMGLPHWKLLAQQIFTFYGDYDGFVILHGTDTMAYTASALSFMLENLGKPVVLTGSMLPMMHISTDAKRNLAVSMMMAGYSQLTELVVIFGSHVLRGTRVSKVDCSRIDAFDSPNFPALGCVGVDVVLHDELLLKPPVRGFRIFTQFCLNIIVFPLTPFLPAEYLRHVLREPSRPLGIVLQLYGSGTAPGTKELLQILKEGIESGVNIVATTQCRRGSANLLAYESGVWLSNLGVINGKDLTLEACIAKLSYLMGKGYSGLALKELMEAAIRGELTESPNKVGAGSMVLDLADNSSYERSRCASIGEEKRDSGFLGGASASPSPQSDPSGPVKPRTESLGVCTLYRHRPDCDPTAPCGDFQLPPDHIRC